MWKRALSTDSAFTSLCTPHSFVEAVHALIFVISGHPHTKSTRPKMFQVMNINKLGLFLPFSFCGSACGCATIIYGCPNAPIYHSHKFILHPYSFPFPSNHLKSLWSDPLRSSDLIDSASGPKSSMESAFQGKWRNYFHQSRSSSFYLPLLCLIPRIMFAFAWGIL